MKHLTPQQIKAFEALLEKHDAKGLTPAERSSFSEKIGIAALEIADRRSLADKARLAVFHLGRDLRRLRRGTP